MTDMSHLDSQYFVDGKTYNCPFCKRNHVPFEVLAWHDFNWTKERACRAVFIKCLSCAKRSMHLSHKEVGITTHNSTRVLSQDDGVDDLFFYSVPTSFFALDNRIPRTLRDLLTEADGCAKSNHLTGASACARKIVYELAKLSKAVGDSYEERIKSLKGIYPNVDGGFFDTLLAIQDVTSTKVHENALDGWDAKHLRVILAAIREVLHEIYVVPAQREDRRKAVLALKDELTAKPVKTIAENRETLRRLEATTKPSEGESE